MKTKKGSETKEEKEGRAEHARLVEWARRVLGQAGKVCSSRWIRLSELKVDPSYQRGYVAEKTLLKMLKGFDWHAFGAVRVMQRKDGTCYTVDGRQRTCVVQRLCDIAEKDAIDPPVLCTVSESEGRAHEARVFHLINRDRTGLPPHANFRAEVVAKSEPQRSINEFLKSRNLTVGQTNGTTPNTIGFANCLIKTWSKDPDACREALRIQQTICGKSEVLVHIIHKGLWYLLHRGYKLATADVRKLIQAGGKEAILTAVAVVLTESGAGERAHTKTCAEGILKILGRSLKPSVVREPEAA